MKNNILILGGGPGGLEAAGQLYQLGHNPVIVEKESSLGGHLANWDRLFPNSIKASDVLGELLEKTKQVKIYLNTYLSSCKKIDKTYHVTLSNGVTLDVVGIIVCTGFSLFPAEKKEEYGYGVYDKVITSADLERYFQVHKDPRITSPKKIGFVHCVGSRDEKVCNKHCSKVCCVTAVKQAIELKQEFPDSQIYCFYMDLRMFGRNYEDMYLEAQSQYGIRFIRGRVSEVSEDINKNVVIKAEDTLSSKPLKVTFDLLVLMVGMRNNDSCVDTSSILNLNLSNDGFFEQTDNMLHSQNSKIEGIFFAGAATGPKSLPDTLNEAKSAVLSIHNYLTKI